MENVNEEVRDISIKSLESTYSKLLNAYQSMTDKGSNTSLVEKRRDAVKLSLDSLKNAWDGVEFTYTKKEILKSREVLQGLMPSIEKQIAKAKDGSPQKTLNERRLIALKLAAESLENRINSICF